MNENLNVFIRWNHWIWSGSGLQCDISVRSLSYLWPPMRGCSQYTCIVHKLFCYLGYIGYFETDQISKNQSKNLDHFHNLQSLLMRNKGVWYCSDIVALVCWPRWECYRKVRQLNNDLVRQLPTNWLHTATNTTIKQLFKLYSCWLDLKNIYMFASSQLVRCDGRWLVERSSMGQMGQ